jgi:hypothetical protein
MRTTEMKKWAGRAGIATAFALAGMLGASAALAGIAATRHNLSTSGNIANVRVTAGTAEICVFCHTPHAADVSAPAPLWNKRLATGATYTTYATLNSSTIDGEILATGSTSLACLSCHDGAQAMDNIINAPGYGGYAADGGGAGGLAYTWDSGTIAGRVTLAGAMTNAPTTLSMLGSDLRNDHPIGIRYCGGGQNSTTPTGACVDRDFVAPQTALINTNRVWWVDTAGGTAAQRDRTDMILYTRTFPVGGTAPSVECGSCHDPHVETGTGTPPAGATFLRISNAASAVCLACHVK